MHALKAATFTQKGTELQFTNAGLYYFQLLILCFAFSIITSRLIP
ncbi:hypothetical protein BTN49_2974 [Candidatus Enterovibrio escicola]|uniref:Uncharacterized protein n=1 Tax=Candidatus Enterovibrio escicola TaxID=1927127 RepID=A0A2A5SZV4_9GAMM|nr:hypothetical protein BTN49_2974 [Candidatus Enterovibrio escacola]